MLSSVHTTGHMVSSNSDNFGLRGRWIAWRNRVLASPRFQRFAARFPLTRPIARRRARELFDLVAGFTYSQILAACIETGLLDELAERPLDADDDRGADRPPDRRRRRLLRGGGGAGPRRADRDAWTLGSDGAALRGNHGIAEMVAHHHLLYADLADPVALLRRGGGGGEFRALALCRVRGAGRRRRRSPLIRR